jgi:drug/metabolite transporter (DMT)-like permease
MPYGLTHLPTQATTETWLAVAALSLFCTAAAFLIFNELIKEAGPSRAVVVTYPNTTLAVIIGIVGLHEPLTIGMLVGFPLVMLGSYWATDGAVRT